MKKTRNMVRGIILVATFLALLSMVKAKRIFIDGDTENPDIVLLQGRGEEIEIDE